MKAREIKPVKSNYLLVTENFPGCTMWSLWEPATQSKTPYKPVSIISSHRTIMKVEDKLWGKIGTNRLPSHILKLTPRSDERMQAEKNYYMVMNKIIKEVISNYVKLPEGVEYMAGNFILRIKNEVEKSQPENPQNRSSVIKDKVRDLLEIASFSEIKKLAELNGVTIKDNDTAGLLKMRLSNALRHKIKNNIEIVTA